MAIMKKLTHKTRTLSILLIGMLFVVLSIYAKTTKSQPGWQQPPVQRSSVVIELKRAGKAYKLANFEPMILVDSVVLYHQGAFMYCDSAHLYEQTNSFEAFSNVRMEQGDTIFVYGDYLHYDGNTKLARLRDNIRMEDKQATLFTDSLNYDRVENLGYYFEGGMLVDDRNELSSYWGQYAPDTKDALFSDSVKLINEDYTLFSDTLKYNTDTKIADILGPSRIVSDSGYIVTSRGGYNTVTDDAQLLDRSEIYSNDGTKVLIGDTTMYNQKTGVGQVYGDMYLEDFQRKAILRGNYGYYDEKREYALATDSAFAIEYSQQDSLFIHGDSMIMVSDSVYRNIRAYDNVRFYRPDFQGVCDTMNYVGRDSTVYMIGNPVVWNQNNQVSGERIEVLMNDSTVERAYVKEFAFVVQKRRVNEQYNQLSGKNMTAYFEKGDLHHVLMEGNAQSRYYIVDDKNSIIGLNATESTHLSADIDKNEVKKVKIWSQPKAKLTPLPLLELGDDKLEGFMLLDFLRPSYPMDIFRSNSRASVSDAMPNRRKFVREDAVQ